MCQSSGIINAWSWSICVGKIGLAGQSQERKTSRPWISSRRSGSTSRILRKSKLWHFFASIQLIELPPRLDACVAIHFLCIYIYIYNIYIYYIIYILYYIIYIYYVFSIAFWFREFTTTPQKQHFPQGKTKATRSPTSFERAARPSSGWWSWRAGTGDGRLMTSPIQQMEATLSQKACDQLALKIGQKVSKVKWGGLWSAQSFSMAGTAENLQWVSPLGRGQHCFARKTLKRRELYVEKSWKVMKIRMVSHD